MPFPVLPGQVQPFSRITVDYLVQGGARVQWSLQRYFIDPGPYIFQLQAGHTADEAATDWVDVGSPVVDTFLVIDSTKRQYGKVPETHYRVMLTTIIGTYFSEPFGILGDLSMRDWLLCRDITRKEKLRHSVLVSAPGYLLKAIRFGPPCPCLDPLTQEVINSNCATCYGTAFLGGYFEPLAGVYCDLSTESAREHLNPQTETIREHIIKGRFVGEPQLESYDVWVNAQNDNRYQIHNIEVKAQHRGVPVIVEVDLRLAPYSDVLYNIPVTPSVALPVPQSQGGFFD